MSPSTPTRKSSIDFVADSCRSFTFWAVLFRNRSTKEIVRQFLGKGIPEMDCLRAYTSNGRWQSGTVFELQADTFIRERWTTDFEKAMMNDGRG